MNINKTATAPIKWKWLYCHERPPDSDRGYLIDYLIGFMMTEKVESLELLRGIAALSVCFCHFGKAVEYGSVTPELFHWLSLYGKYGVEIFFVVSGFVIPYSLARGKYRINNYFSFLWKRLIRLHPPYLGALFLSLAIAGLAYKLKHVVNPETFGTIAWSLIYAHVPTDNPVFWTLRIEAEYYLIIGLIYVVLQRQPYYLSLLIIAIAELSQIYGLNSPESIIAYINYFMLGTLLHLHKAGTLNKVQLSTLLLLIIFYLFVNKMPLGAIVASLSATAIIFGYKNKPHMLFGWLGKISYSLYLIHFPIGIKFINLVSKHFDSNLNWILFLLATTISLMLASLFYKVVEYPCAIASARVKYLPTSNVQTSAVQN